jgi:hypothetical protein
VDSITVTAVVTLAATVLTAIATSYAIWQRHRSNPVPRWEKVDEYGDLEPVGLHTLPVTLVNVGDGDAFNVRINSKSHKTYIAGGSAFDHFPIARVSTADRLELLVQLHYASGHLRDDGQTMDYSDTRKYTDRFVEFEVVWNHPPRRGKIRREKFRIDVPLRYQHAPV